MYVQTNAYIFVNINPYTFQVLNKYAEIKLNIDISSNNEKNTDDNTNVEYT